MTISFSLEEKQNFENENGYEILNLTTVKSPEFYKFYSSNTVSLSLISSQDFSIFYTEDGEDPKVSGIEYSEPIIINEEKTIRAVCFYNNVYSEEVSEKFLKEIIPINRIHEEAIVSPEKNILYRAYPIQEPLFLSVISEEPYKEPTEIFESKSFQLTNSSDYEVFFEEEKIFLIFQKKFFKHIELRIENELGLGTSLYVSELDNEEKPIKFKKKLTFKNIDATTFVVKIPLIVRWEMINNEEVVKKMNQSSFLNIYEIEKE